MYAPSYRSIGIVNTSGVKSKKGRTLFHLASHIYIAPNSYGKTSGRSVEIKAVDCAANTELNLYPFSSRLPCNQILPTKAIPDGRTGENSYNWYRYPLSQPAIRVAGDIGCQMTLSTLDLNNIL